MICCVLFKNNKLDWGYCKIKNDCIFQTAMTEESLMTALSGSPADRNEALGVLYTWRKYRQPVMDFLRTHKLDNQVMETIWIDVVIGFSKTVRKGNYQHEGKLKSYLVNASRFLVLNRYRDGRKAKNEISAMAGTAEAIEYPSLCLDAELRRLLIEEMNKVIGAKCRKILFLWGQDYTMEEIRQKMGIVSVEATRKQKHTCLKKFSNHVRSIPGLLSDLKEYYQFLFN